jgi:hypothetical protein
MSENNNSNRPGRPDRSGPKRHSGSGGPKRFDGPRGAKPGGKPGARDGKPSAGRRFGDSDSSERPRRDDRGQSRPERGGFRRDERNDRGALRRGESGGFRREDRQESGDRAGFRRDDRPERGDRGGFRRDDRPDRGGLNRDDRARPSRERDSDEPEVVFPALDDDVEPKLLDRMARRELAGLDKDKADFVANHLVMVARLVDDEPERAHEHAKAALVKGSRIPVVRETLGITAYLTGDFALSLRELRTHRRLTRQDVNVPMMIDCERGLGRPNKGLELATEVNRAELPDGVAVELAIAVSGCRLDLGQGERALLELEIPQLNPDKAFSYSPALFDAYAVVLEELGRAVEAAEWGKRAQIAQEALEEAEFVDELEVFELEEVEPVDEGEPIEEQPSP